MQAPVFIDKLSANDPMQKYQLLRNEALKILQELSGDTWTDYNLHDPGITILEQLCYAITELEYKAGFDVKDLLTDESTGKIDYERLGLYLPHEIYPSRAVTKNDFRKIIFDAIPETYNVWVYPEVDFKINGLYSIVAGIEGSDLMNQIEKDAYYRQIRDVFCRNRNLGEDLYRVEILKTEEVKVFAEIEIVSHCQPDDVMAKILFALSCYMQEEIRYYSFHELQDKGLSLEEIFTGPLLENGFICEDELKSKHSKIEITQILQRASGIDGVIGIPLLYFEHKGLKSTNYIDFESRNTGPSLFIPKTDKEQTIRLTKNGRMVQVNHIDVRSKYFHLKALYRNPYKHEFDYLKLVPPIQGAYKNVKEYYSIQNQFPDVYGINHRGIGASTIISEKTGADNGLRIAQAKQLKAYLMIFEQIMANFLAQLDSLKYLYAKDYNGSISYFSQKLNTVPNSDGLYVDLQNDLECAIAEILLNQDDFLDRRSRQLDYLLGMYGETFTQNALSQFNYYYRPDELEEIKIRNKVRFLTRLPKLSKNKAKAFSYIDQAWNTTNVSGLEERVCILLGLKDSKDKSCISIFDRKGLNLMPEVNIHGGDDYRCSLFNQDRDISDHKTVEEHFQFVSFDSAFENTIHASDEMLYQQIFPLAENKISEHFLRSGVDSKSYKIGRIDGSDQYTLAHFFRKLDKWKVIGIFDTSEQASRAAINVRNLLIELNKDSEGIHLIEHILLRPDDDTYIYNTKVQVPGYDKALYGTVTFDKLAEADKKNTILASLSDRNNYGYYQHEGKGCRIWVDIDAAGRLECEVWEPNHKAATDKIAEICSYFQVKHEDVDLWLENVQLTCFFSFGISVVLPRWTSRYNNQNFRAMVEDTLHYCAPAHLYIDIHWMSSDRIREFETHYVKWLDTKKATTPDLELIRKQSENIIAFLIKSA